MSTKRADPQRTQTNELDASPVVAPKTSRFDNMAFIFGEEDDYCDNFYMALRNVSLRTYGKVGNFGTTAYAMVEGTSDENCVDFFYHAQMEEMERIYNQVKSGAKPMVRGYEVSSIQLALPYDDSYFVPIHYINTFDDDDDGDNEIPGYVRRHNGRGFEVLVPIIPSRGQCSQTIVTWKTPGWEVRESIMYAGVDDVEWKEELENNGYYRLARSEAIEDDVKFLGLENKEFFVLGRNELVNLNKPYAGYLSRQHPWGPNDKIDFE